MLISEHLGGVLEGTERPSAEAFDVRITAAFDHIEQAEESISTYFENMKDNNYGFASSESMMSGMAEAFHNISNGIGGFFQEALGTTKPVISDLNHDVAEFAAKLDVAVDDLKKLQSVQQRASDLYAALGATTPSAPGASLSSTATAQLESMLQGLAETRQMFRAFVQRPVATP